MKAKELAERLGVSQTTLSMVINNKGNISTKTRERLKRQLEELGYGYLLNKETGSERQIEQPEGRSVGKTEDLEPGSKLNKGCIGFVLYKDSGLFINNTSFFPLLLDGMDKAARKYGYRFMVINITSDMDRQSKLDYIKHSGCSGFVIYAPELTEDDADELQRMDIDFVLLDKYFPDKGINSVTLDNEQGICALLKLLQENGHRNVGYLRGDVTVQSFEERRAAFLKYAPKFGMHIYRDDVLEIGYPEDKALETMKRYLDECRNLPTAFLCDNDCIALGAAQALQQSGYSIPKDISIAGFADRPQCMFITPNITTVRIPRDMFGGEAVDMLINKVMKEVGREEGCVLNTKVSLKLVSRESVGTAPVKPEEGTVLADK